MTHKPDQCALAVIGTGMAGMAASLFAIDQGLDTVQVGMTGAINFASGLFDLCGVHPVSTGTIVEDPWEGISRLAQEEPLHPYARLGIEPIRQAMTRVLSFLQEADLLYFHVPRRNRMAITPVGTRKPTYAVPASLRAGIEGQAAGKAGLLIDFFGLRGFSAGQIAAGIAPYWPALRTGRIPFPGERGELYPERMARSLEAEPVRELLAAAIRPLLEDAGVVGLPAVLGISLTTMVCSDLAQRLGVPVFEIPTMLPAVAGLRLREAFETRLPRLGVRPFYQHRVCRVSRQPDGHWHLAVDGDGAERIIRAAAVILASGRFLGRGLHADRDAIRETIFDLPVKQPGERAAWHDKRLFAPCGHPINRAGLAVDDRLRPVNARGETIHANLFAAGSILADQDWVRQKCGSGLAIATAYGAVQAVRAFLSQPTTEQPP